MEFNVYEVLGNLAKRRPVFHSEADFQFAMAWEIQKLYPSASVRLEYNPQIFDSKAYIDIWVKMDNGKSIAIELKYKTKKTTLLINEEKFELEKHGAPANNRFLIVQDISRVEKVVNQSPNTDGYAVVVTNDNEYWQEWKRPKDTKDKAFRIHEGTILSGLLKWKDDTAETTVNTLGGSLDLTREYKMNWTDYYVTEDIQFKCLVNKVSCVESNFLR